MPRPCSCAHGPWAGGAFGTDAFQQHAGRLVVGVLRHQLAGEGLFQDGLAQGFGLLQGGGDDLLNVVRSRKNCFDFLS